MKVYIYSSDKYGNPGAFYTTLESFKEMLADVAQDFAATGEEVPELHEDIITGDILDQDGEVVLIEATPNNIEGFTQIDDPLDLMK